MELASAERVPVVGVTRAGAKEATAYRSDERLVLPILADAAVTQDAWGVDMVWGNIVRLVDPEGRIVANDLASARNALRGR